MLRYLDGAFFFLRLDYVTMKVKLFTLVCKSRAGCLFNGNVHVYVVHRLFEFLLELHHRLLRYVDSTHLVKFRYRAAHFLLQLNGTVRVYH